MEDKKLATAIDCDSKNSTIGLDYKAEYEHYYKKCCVLEMDLEKYKVALLNLSLSIRIG